MDEHVERCWIHGRDPIARRWHQFGPLGEIRAGRWHERRVHLQHRATSPRGYDWGIDPSPPTRVSLLIPKQVAVSAPWRSKRPSRDQRARDPPKSYWPERY